MAAQMQMTEAMACLLYTSMNNWLNQLERKYGRFGIPNLTNILVGGQILVPVSYTHLDVYKRQLHGRKGFVGFHPPADQRPLLRGQHLPPYMQILLPDGGQGFVDVYKRQQLFI